MENVTAVLGRTALMIIILLAPLFLLEAVLIEECRKMLLEPYLTRLLPFVFF